VPGLADLPKHIHGIDTMMGGHAGLTASFLIGGDRPALVETGPARVAATVAEGVAAAGVAPEDLAWLVVTHIHLDHAGGLGDLVRAFPNARVVVHPAGARHLADPTRLMASSARVYGELLDVMYGPLTPVPPDRIHAAEDGERLDLGGASLEMLHAPGHAKHHLAVAEPDAGVVFAGDAVGVVLDSGAGRLRPAMPPPDFDPELAIGSLRRMAERDPALLVLTHFGPVDAPQARLAEAEDLIRRYCQTAEDAASVHGIEVDHIEAALRERFADETAGGEPKLMGLLNSFRSNAAGLARWLEVRRRAEAEAEAEGRVEG
jgi:glyoxylase-like metal-dependent hydrolase (beta-lactamase superfamily II)